MSRPLLIAWLFLWAMPAVYSQKIERYFDYRWHDTTAANARFYSLLEKTDSGWHRKDYYLHSLALQMEGLYKDSACKVPAGNFRYYHPTRVPESMGAYRDGKKQGPWLRYYSNGTIEDSTVYDQGNPVGIRLGWYRNGYPSDSASYNPDGSGIQVLWFDNGYPSAAGRYAAGFKKYGKWQYFYREGGLSAFEIYDQQGLLLDKKYFDEKGVPVPDTANKDKGAEFPGGLKAWGNYLGKALYFPDQYKFTNGDQAVVVVEATIDEEGKVADAEVVVPFYPAFDKIALEAIRRSPAWAPAFRHHRKVSDRIRQPVIFSQPE
jgi:TonB family protein